MTVSYPAREIPVLMHTQVCVLGGGTAGITAAASAARNGAKTVLVERLGYLGGTTTAGMVCIWHLSDGVKQVVRGEAQRLVERLAAEDPAGLWVAPGYPVLEGAQADKSHEFRGEAAKQVFEEYVQESGAELLLYTIAADVLRTGDRITALLVATKTGLQAITADYFIDASGDGFLAARAGVPFWFGREDDGLVQGMTMMFRMDGIDGSACQSLTYGSPEAESISRDMAKERDAGRLPPFGGVDFAAYAQGRHANMNPASGNPLDERELTRCTLETRSRISAYLEYYREHVPGYRHVRLAQCADEIGIRESRRIQGEYVFSREDMVEERRFPDAIGHGFWCIDIHDPKGSGTTTWTAGATGHLSLPKGHNYQIPFRIMKPVGVSNLLVAGRCVSATHEGISSLRIQSECMVMGQAAGTACALCVGKGIALSELPIRALQETLLRQDAYLELPEEEDKVAE